MGAGLSTARSWGVVKDADTDLGDDVVGAEARAKRQRH
jgi:hypothetical protein